ncbi:MAG: SH3 domain-containing protein [Clostridiales bacterium]|nr:SH3 domain-containing protein [Clostridiales bacterium]
MKKYQAIKAAVFAATALVFLSASKDKAYAGQMAWAEVGVAGISKTLNDIYTCGDDSLCEKVTELYKAEIYSPYSNLGVSIATNYVNIRKEPSTESEIVGKLYNGCAADILEWLEGDWVRIVSGDVEGYIASNYLATGKEAEKLVDKYAEKYATVARTQTLRVREQPSTESRTLELIPLGERFPVIKEYEEWAEILISTDDRGRDFSGFVHKDYIDIEVIFKKAISIEEEQRLIRQQQEAERAEAERLQRLAEEQERKRLEEERRKEEERKAAEEKKQSSTSTSGGGGSSGSALGIEIANYAQKFVGNRYVWGGTSLTKGADCSGFVYTIYKQFGYNIPRVSRDQAKSAGRKVDISERQPGDLIFYTDNKGVVNHVALYIGDDKIVHAASSKQGIIISKYNYREVYCIRRVID